MYGIPLRKTWKYLKCIKVTNCVYILFNFNIWNGERSITNCHWNSKPHQCYPNRCICISFKKLPLLQSYSKFFDNAFFTNFVIISGSWYSRWEDKIDEEVTEKFVQDKEEKRKRNTKEVSRVAFKGRFTLCVKSWAHELMFSLFHTKIRYARRIILPARKLPVG